MGEEPYQGDARFLEWQKERARRVEKNEQAFRAYNERRQNFEKGGLLAGESAPFVCECADTDCWASVDLTVDEFESAHDSDDHYSVLPGHVMPEFERVVEKHERHWVVEKFTPQEVEERLVTDANCHIYVCGLKDMEEGVDRAFRDACREHGVDWDARLPELRAQGRYHVETY